MTVKGWISASQMGPSLSHEHVMVDFIGADKTGPSRYDREEVFQIVLPHLLALKNKGCQTLVECTPAYLGRDPGLLLRLSVASGLNMLTNTGYYGAAGEKYIPQHAYKETSQQLANRWIAEWKEGIAGTGIRPGFIKSGVDTYPLSTMQTTLVEAGVVTHLATGLTLGIHTGDGKAALEELAIIRKGDMSPAGWIWIHAQNEKDREIHFRVAKAGGWVSYDGVSENNIGDCIQFLKDMKSAKLMHRVLLSQDAGWYHVGEPRGGTFNNYITIADHLLPALKENGFSESELKLLLTGNPAQAFAVRSK
jgi:phosphotriesterase-related protein